MVDFDERIAPCFRTLEDQRRRLSEQDASIKQLQNQLAAAKSSAAKEKIHATKFKDELSKLKSRNVKLQRQCDATTALAEHANASIVALNETVGAQQARIKTLEERTGEDQKKLLQRKKLQAEVADLKRQLAGSEHKRRRESTDAEVSKVVCARPALLSFVRYRRRQNFSFFLLAVIRYPAKAVRVWKLLIRLHVIRKARKHDQEHA
jgi:chromosome segregation ATPase